MADTTDLRAFFQTALPQVYGYVLARCGDARLAEDITSDAFLTLAHRRQAGEVVPLTVGWLIVVARNRLVDHWRRTAREEQRLRLVAGDVDGAHRDDDDEMIDLARLEEALTRLSDRHRAALSLRYLDDLPVPEVAAALSCSVHATESLLVRAREALRRAYVEVGNG